MSILPVPSSQFILFGRFLQKKLFFNSKVIDKNSRNQVKIIQESLGSFRDIILSNNQKYFLEMYRNVESIIRLKYAENIFINVMPRYAVEGFFLVTLAILVYIMSFDKSNFTNSNFGL